MKLSFGLFAAMLLATVQDSKPLGPTDKADCSAYPDPHFKTWHGNYYDFHGGCDLIMLKIEKFVPGGLHLHIRTRDKGGWSSITNAALRIGSDILEVMDNGNYFVNGILNPTPPTIGTYDLIISTFGSTTIYEVLLNMGQYVKITFGSFLRVEVSGIGYDFLDSVGLCGTWTTPGLIARDGGTILTENDFGKEWQVRNTEPLLFQPASDSDPQYPKACSSAPDVSRKFANKEMVGKARNICNRVRGPDFDNCVFDVVATGNDNWVEEYHQTLFQEECMDNGCSNKGGKCMMKCNTDGFFCVRNICCGGKKNCNCLCAVPRKGGPIRPKNPGTDEP